MTINIRGIETASGTLEKVKFDTEKKIYMTGKYNVIGGNIMVQAKSNREVKDVIKELQAQGFTKVEEI